MPSVLIVGPDFIGTCDALARGFSSIGCDVRVFSWGRPKSSIVRKFQERALGRTVKQAYLGKWFNRLLRLRVIPQARAGHFDLIVFIKPQEVDRENFIRLKKLSCQKITWATDSLERFPGQQSLLSICEKTYVMDGGDVTSSSFSWMPLGFDDRVFRPSAEPKVYDAIFVGNVFSKGYTTRRFVFEALRSSGLGKSNRIAFVGCSPFALHNHLRWMPGRLEWVSRSLPLDGLATAVASSRVCVNIHQDDGQQPVNPMFFAIPGSGVCQVTDDRKYLQTWMTPNSDYVAVEPSKIVDCLEVLLKDEERVARIARSGFEKAKNHTYLARARQILSDLSINS